MILSENMKSLRLADEDAGICYVVVGCRGPLEAPKWVKDPENGLISGVLDPFRGL